MPITVAAPAQHVPVFSSFDYVTIDEARHRAYAAHTGSRRLLIIDTEAGKVVGQVSVGMVHGVAVDPESGDVFTGNGTYRSLSKVDPATMKILATVDVPGEIDAIAYDAGMHRVYADEDGGSHVYVIDGQTMKLIATITMPSSDLESPAVDPRTHILYQNLADKNAFAVVDPHTLAVTKVVATKGIQDNHPLAFASSARVVAVGGRNGVFSTYSPEGIHLADVPVQLDIDQCGTGSVGRYVVCAGQGIITVIDVQSGHPPAIVGRLDTGHPIHTAGIDERTGDIWVVWSDPTGDYLQRLRWKA